MYWSRNQIKNFLYQNFPGQSLFLLADLCFLFFLLWKVVLRRLGQYFKGSCAFTQLKGAVLQLFMIRLVCRWLHPVTDMYRRIYNSYQEGVATYFTHTYYIHYTLLQIHIFNWIIKGTVTWRLILTYVTWKARRNMMSMVKIVKNIIFSLIFNFFFKILAINGTETLGGCP